MRWGVRTGEKVLVSNGQPALIYREARARSGAHEWKQGEENKKTNPTSIAIQ